MLRFFNLSLPFPFSSLKFDSTDVYLVVSLKYFLHCVTFLKLTSFISTKALLDLVVVDTPTHSKRFELTYLFLSVVFNLRVYLRVYLSEFQLVPSLMSFFPSASWLEREAWDMFGVCFVRNKDLRRILTDYGFDGFPLRKDFPLSGFSEVRYDDSEKRIVVEPLEVSQEFRKFSFTSPWVVKNS